MARIVKPQKRRKATHAGAGSAHTSGDHCWSCGTPLDRWWLSCRECAAPRRELLRRGDPDWLDACTLVDRQANRLEADGAGAEQLMTWTVEAAQAANRRDLNAGLVRTLAVEVAALGLVMLRRTNRKITTNHEGHA